MRELAIEGVDGVGKTTVIKELKGLLEADGQTVMVAQPYHEVAREYPGIDVYEALQNGRLAQTALDTVALMIGKAQAKAYDEHVDVLIWDRHWMTAKTEIERNRPRDGVWIGGKPMTALLDPDTEVSPELYDRMVDDKEPWTATKEIVDDYAQRYRQLAWSFRTCLLGVYRVDGLTTPQKLARAIRWDLAKQR